VPQFTMASSGSLNQCGGDGERVASRVPQFAMATPVPGKEEIRWERKKGKVQTIFL
jgi:hypothetical protein